MATYLALNLGFVVVAIIIAGIYYRTRRISGVWWLTLLGLLILTLIFDNVLIATEIVGYDSTKILGWYLGLAPIEDFFYTVLAVIIVPLLWHVSTKLFPERNAAS